MRGRLYTYAKLDGDREEVGADLLSDGIASRDSREVDVARLNQALLTLDGLDDLLGETVFFYVSHRQ